MKPAFAAFVTVLLLAGCASAPPSKYDTVEDLKDAFVAAGATCDDWVQTDQISLAAQSGTCGDDEVLSIYLSESSRDQVISNLKELSEGIGMELLVGENWVINTDEADKFKEKLGGTVVTSD